jgi:hypothetical protein
MKKVYPDVPELDWLKQAAESDGIEHSTDCALGIGGPCDCPFGLFQERLNYVYKYVLWFRRMNLSVPQSDEFLIAFGFVVKYRALIFGTKLEKRDQKTVAIAEEQYKKLRRGEKLT